MWNYKRKIKKAISIILFGYFLDGWLRKGLIYGRPKYFSKPTDKRMAKILKRMDILKEKFFPTFWAHTSYLQMLVFFLWNVYYQGTAQFQTHKIKCDDGGQVCIDIFIEPIGKKLSKDAPIILFLHTLTGTTAETTEFAKYAFSRGWRPIVLCRRGHFGKLKTPKFNIMGCVEDTKRMILKVKDLFPGAFIGACGISAGSGQIISYIGNQNADFPVQAALSLCPAYDIRNAFSRFQNTNPLFAKLILWSMKKFFLVKNSELLSSIPGYSDALTCSNIHNFMVHSSQMAGYDSFASYLKASNPMEHYSKNQIPCLILNSVDDPLCLEKNIRYDIANSTDHYALVTTKCGSHIAFREGIFGQSSFMHRLSIDFLEAAYKELHQIQTQYNE